MGVFFDRAALPAAFDAVGAAARDDGAGPELAVYGGAALMPASDFRFGTEDVDIAEIGTPQPGWPSAAVRDFLRAFHAAPTAEARAGMLAQEQPRLGAHRGARVGGIAEDPSEGWSPDDPPRWVGGRARHLDEPWFPNGRDDPALMEHLSFASPAETESRNVMVDDEPPRRANTPRR